MLSVLKLVVKQLIDSSLSQGCMLDDVHGPLLQFFTIMESMMCHGIKREIYLCLDLSFRLAVANVRYFVFITSAATSTEQLDITGM